MPAFYQNLDIPEYSDNAFINGYFKDKNARLRDYILNQGNRTATMFTYKNKKGGELPEGFHELQYERFMQFIGFTGLHYKDGKVYILKGNPAPPINYLEENTGYLVANAYDTDLSGLYKIANLDEAKNLSNCNFKGDIILSRNDPFCFGLLPIFTHYGIQTVENDITFRMANINLRQLMNFIVSDENSEESAKLYYEHVEDGQQSIIMDENFEFDGVKGNPLTIPAGFMTQLIEASQYIKASMLNEIGMNANYNMKRERLSESESDLNEDILRPLPDIMLEERENAFKAFEDLTGGEVAIQPDFGSIWLKNSIAFDQSINDILTGDDDEDEGEPVEDAAENIDTEDTDTEQSNEESPEEEVDEGDPESDPENEEREPEEVEPEEETEETEEPTEEPEETEEEPSEAVEEIVEIVDDIKEIVEDITDSDADEETEEPDEEPEDTEEDDEDDEADRAKDSDAESDD